MAGPNAALAQGFQNLAQAAQGIAAQIPNWQPAAQHAQLVQVLQTQQQTQQTLQQMQQTQQQMQQTLQQVQQTQLQMQQQLGTLDFNGHVRTLNSRLNPPQQVAWIRNAAGQVPQQAPMSLATLQAARGPQLAPLLAHYGLPAQGTVAARRIRLQRHLGIPA